MTVEKLYECENYLVVNKPFDMYINSNDENEKNTVTAHIASPDSHLSTSAHPLHFVQRLDYATSGVLCIAKNKIAATRAGKLFEGRETKKYYIAIVRGHVQFELADIQYSVGSDPLAEQSNHRMMAVTSNSQLSTGLRLAHTRLLVLETGYYDNDPVSVVLLKPITDSMVVPSSPAPRALPSDRPHNPRGLYLQWDQRQYSTPDVSACDQASATIRTRTARHPNGCAVLQRCTVHRQVEG